MSRRVCLVEWILGKMEKKKRENEEENFFGECLVERRRGKKKVGSRCFLLRPTRKFSPQNREKTIRGV